MECSVCESAERKSSRGMPGTIQYHSMGHPWTHLNLTCEIQSPVGRCHYSGAKVLSEQEKKNVYESSLQGARQRADFMQDFDECALWTSSSSGVERD